MTGAADIILFFSASIQKLSDWTNRIAEWICILCGAGIVVSLTLAVLSRYVFPFSFIWPEEAARFFMIWITFIGGSVALKRRGLVSFQFVLDALPDGWGRYFRFSIHLAVITFILFFLYYGFICLEMYKKITALGTHISYFWPALGMIIGGILMLIHSTTLIWEDLKKESV